MNPRDLIELAERLALLSPGKPRQVELRRAVSTAYYALFHAMCADALQVLAGGSDTDTARRVYRALDHGAAKTACAQIDAAVWPATLVDFATAVVTLQQARQLADYDPFYRLTPFEAFRLIRQAAAAIDGLAGTPKAARRRFAVLLLFRKR